MIMILGLATPPRFAKTSKLGPLVSLKGARNVIRKLRPSQNKDDSIKLIVKEGGVLPE